MMRLLCLMLLIATPLWAVQPGEVLDDPALEARARQISQGLRCLVCRNESIDDSNADLARDLRVLVRERLTAGDSDTEVVAYVVERYGEYVLLTPKRTGSNLLLWWSGPLMLLAGAAIAGFYLRRRRSATETVPEPLSADEEARLREILDQ